MQKVAYLAEFHFKCERNPEGQTNYDWGYWFWILKVRAPAAALPFTYAICNAASISCCTPATTQLPSTAMQSDEHLLLTAASTSS
jgi:hypothetical protein